MLLVNGLKNGILILSLLLSLPLVADPNGAVDEITKDINREYQENIKPIFAQKCFSCHTKSKISWVESRLFFKDFLKEKVDSALGEFQLGDSFPQKNLKNELKKIRTQIHNDVMPPNYALILMSPFMNLSKEEKDLVLKWVDDSLNKINSKK